MQKDQAKVNFARSFSFVCDSGELTSSIRGPATGQSLKSKKITSESKTLLAIPCFL
jgi:hypothetical protein